MKKIMIFGTFDRLHPGHEFVLREAQRRGAVTVVVARDDNVRRIKGAAPTESERVRMNAIRRIAPAARVLLGHAVNFLAPVLEIKPDLILLGYDQAMPPNVQEADLPCPIERLPAFKPEQFKSSLMKKQK